MPIPSHPCRSSPWATPGAGLCSPLTIVPAGAGAPPGRRVLYPPSATFFCGQGFCGPGARGPHRVRRHASYFPSQNTPAVRGGDGHQFRAFEKSTSYGDVRTRNWLTVLATAQSPLLRRKVARSRQIAPLPAVGRRHPSRRRHAGGQIATPNVTVCR